MNRLLRHRIHNPGELLDDIRRGQRTSLDAIEFDVMVRNGELIIGHPSEIRVGKYQPGSVDAFFELLDKISVRQILIDCRADGFDPANARDMFTSDEVQILCKRLNEVLQQYAAGKDEDIDREFILNCTSPEVFAYLHEHPELCEGARKMYVPSPKESDQLFSTIDVNHVDGVGLRFPMKSADGRALTNDEKRNALREIAEQAVAWKAGHDSETDGRLIVTMYPINTEVDAVLLNKVFSEYGLNVEMISDVATQLEKPETRQRARLR